MVGSKASQLAKVHSLITGKTSAKTYGGFAIPFCNYMAHLDFSSARKEIDQLLEKSKNEAFVNSEEFNDYATEKLIMIQSLIQDTPIAGTYSLPLEICMILYWRLYGSIGDFFATL